MISLSQVTYIAGV